MFLWHIENNRSHDKGKKQDNQKMSLNQNYKLNIVSLDGTQVFI